MFISDQNYKQLNQIAREGTEAIFKFNHQKDKLERLERMYESNREELIKLKILLQDKETYEGKYDYTLRDLRDQVDKLKSTIHEKDALLNKYKVDNSVIIESEVNKKVNIILTDVIKNQDSLLKAFTGTKE